MCRETSKGTESMSLLIIIISSSSSSSSSGSSISLLKHICHQFFSGLLHNLPIIHCNQYNANVWHFA